MKNTFDRFLGFKYSLANRYNLEQLDQLSCMYSNYSCDTNELQALKEQHQRLCVLILAL